MGVKRYGPKSMDFAPCQVILQWTPAPLGLPQGKDCEFVAWDVEIQQSGTG